MLEIQLPTQDIDVHAPIELMQADDKQHVWNDQTPERIQTDRFMDWAENVYA